MWTEAKPDLGIHEKLCIGIFMASTPVTRNTPCSLYFLQDTLFPASCITLYLPFLRPSQSSSSNHVWCCSKVKQLLELGSSVLGGLDAVADSARVLVDLVVVTALVCLVAEEVDGGVLVAILLLSLDVLQAVCLVPASGENVE